MAHKTGAKDSVVGMGDRDSVGLHFVRADNPVGDSGGKKILARVAGGRRKQRDCLRHRHANLAIRLRARESVLHCAVFLQRVELAQAIAATHIAQS